MRNAAHEKTIGRFFLCDNGQRRLVKIRDQRGHLFLAGVVFVARMNGGNGKAFAVRIGVGQRPFQSAAAKDDDETMFLAGLDEDVRVAELFHSGRKHPAKLFARLRRDASGAAVGDNSLFIERAEVCARGHVAVFQFQSQPQRFNYTAADLEFQGIVAEQTEMTRTAAGRDAGRGGNHAALRGILAQPVEVWRGGGFQRGEKILFPRGNVTEAVEHDQREFGVGFQRQFGIKRIQIHPPILQQARRSAMRIQMGLKSCAFQPGYLC